MTGKQNRAARWVVVVFGLVILVIIACVVYQKRRSPPRPSDETSWFDDPRLTYDTPYKNVKPNVKYVGDKVCAECHKKIHDDFRQHPMGRSAFKPEEVTADEILDSAHRNPFSINTIRYQVTREKEGVWHEETLMDPEDNARTLGSLKGKVALVIGSGTHGRSYLVERNGYVFQSPISWYTQKQIWDLSPGYSPDRHFNRPIVGGCLFCHVNAVEPVPGTLNRYKGLEQAVAIGCERCHGPGDLHVSLRRTGEWMEGVDRTIVNPAHLPLSLRESICQQCHLQAEMTILRPGLRFFDYRPGLPVHLFFEVFARPMDPNEGLKAVGQVQQMYASRCFLESNKSTSMKGMGCISCHDPHWAPPPDKVVTHYRTACLKCHQDKGCSLPYEERVLQQKEDSCVHCHMPKKKTKDIAHTALTDHSILRSPGTNRPNRRYQPIPGEPQLFSFHQDLLEPTDRAALRTRGIACASAVGMYGPNLPKKVRSEFLQYSIHVLTRRVENVPQDIDAWNALAEVLAQANQPEEARSRYEFSLSKNPDQEAIQAQAAFSAIAADQPTEAIRYFRAALSLNPELPEYRRRLIQLLAKQGEWQDLADECERYFAYSPNDAEARQLFLLALLKTGQHQREDAEFTKACKFCPNDIAKFQKVRESSKGSVP